MKVIGRILIQGRSLAWAVEAVYLKAGCHCLGERFFTPGFYSFNKIFWQLTELFREAL